MEGWKRAFIPAQLADNPYLDATTYLMSLEQLDDDLQAMLLYGDWDARAPGNWVIGNPEWVDFIEGVGEQMWEDGVQPLGKRVITAHDWGEITQSYIIYELPDGGIFVPPSEVVGRHEDPALVSGRALQMVLRYPYTYNEARYDAAGVQSMRTYMGIVRRYPGLGHVRSTKINFGKYKRDGMGYIRHLARRTAEGYQTRILAIHPDNIELCRQLRIWERKADETEETTKEDDHGCDALLAGLAPVAARHRAFIEEGFRKAQGDTDNIYERPEAA